LLYRLVALALFLAIMIPLGIGWHYVVYDLLPQRAVELLAVGSMCLAVGFLLGQRHGLHH